MLAATIASHCNLNQYTLGDRCLWLRGRIVLPTLIIMAATATDGVRDSMELDCIVLDTHKYQRCIGLLALVLQFWYEYGGDEQQVC